MHLNLTKCPNTESVEWSGRLSQTLKCVCYYYIVTIKGTGSHVRCIAGCLLRLL